MKEFDAFTFDKATYETELSRYEELLQSKETLSENKDILPFFKENKQLLAHMGKSSLPDVFPVNRIAYEYHLFGDLVCDAVIGNSQTQTYCFIEFEDASKNSLFVQKKGKYQSVYAPRFEQGYSQVVDWFYKLRHVSPYDLQERFGSDRIYYHGILIIGRNHFLSKSEENRLLWRQRHTILDSRHIHVFTLDDLLLKLKTPNY